MVVPLDTLTPGRITAESEQWLPLKYSHWTMMSSQLSLHLSPKEMGEPSLDVSQCQLCCTMMCPPSTSQCWSGASSFIASSLRRTMVIIFSAWRSSQSSAQKPSWNRLLLTACCCPHGIYGCSLWCLWATIWWCHLGMCLVVPLCHCNISASSTCWRSLGHGTLRETGLQAEGSPHRGIHIVLFSTSGSWTCPAPIPARCIDD